MVKVLHDSLLSLIYPHECHRCSKLVETLDNGSACDECWNSTRLFQGSEMLCSKCGAFFGIEAAPTAVQCHDCDADQYEKAVAVGIYEKALATSILELKTTPRLPVRLRTAFRETLKRVDLTEANLIVPVPLSKLRKLERGFNQSEIIAGEIAAATGIRVDSASLVRIKHSPIHRVGMDKKARQMTVRNAFAVVRPKLFTGKNIILVDDVFTSGATTSGCAQVLKQNGARNVIVFTLARAVLN